jgi:hypothetical protein
MTPPRKYFLKAIFWVGVTLNPGAPKVAQAESTYFCNTQRSNTHVVVRTTRGKGPGGPHCCRRGTAGGAYPRWLLPNALGRNGASDLVLGNPRGHSCPLSPLPPFPAPLDPQPAKGGHWWYHTTGAYAGQVTVNDVLAPMADSSRARHVSRALGP